MGKYHCAVRLRRNIEQQNHGPYKKVIICKPGDVLDATMLGKLEYAKYGFDVVTASNPRAKRRELGLPRRVCRIYQPANGKEERLSTERTVRTRSAQTSPAKPAAAAAPVETPFDTIGGTEATQHVILVRYEKHIEDAKEWGRKNLSPGFRVQIEDAPRRLFEEMGKPSYMHVFSPASTKESDRAGTPKRRSSAKHNQSAAALA